jgi:CrcB protein
MLRCVGIAIHSPILEAVGYSHRVTTRFTWVAVALGGALGGGTRAILDLPALTGGEANLWTILLVNLAGAGLLGGVIGHGTPTWSIPLRAGVTTGFLSSFTTFSAIMTGWLGLTLVPDPLIGLVYIAATFLGGVIAAYGGLHAGEWWRQVTTPGAAT